MSSVHATFPERTKHLTQKLDNGTDVFYREAGPIDGPVMILLHGFPSSSHQYRNLIPLLANAGYRVVAPDLPGFGRTKVPSGYKHTFKGMGEMIEKFTDKLSIKKFAIYIFDYGAPTGFRVAIKHPERITAIVSQSGNAYVEGLTPFWDPIKAYWNDPTSSAKRDAIRSILTRQTTEYQYFHGAQEGRKGLISPDEIDQTQAIIDRDNDVQLDLFLDYGTNIPEYPKWQKFLRDYKPPVFAIWGKHDPIFGNPGATGYKKDLPETKVVFVDAGHFALETHVGEIAEQVIGFLDANLKR